MPDWFRIGKGSPEVPGTSLLDAAAELHHRVDAAMKTPEQQNAEWQRLDKIVSDLRYEYRAAEREKDTTGGRWAELKRLSMDGAIVRLRAEYQEADRLFRAAIERYNELKKQLRLAQARLDKVYR